MALDRAPLTNLTNQQKALQTRNTQLTSIQTALQTVAMNAQALGSPGLLPTSQTATSSDTTRVSATTNGGRSRRRLSGCGHAARELRAADVHVHQPGRG